MRLPTFRVVLAIGVAVVAGCSASVAPTPSAMPNVGALVQATTGLSSSTALSLSLTPPSVRGPINGAGLERVQVTLTNRSGSPVEFAQSMTLFRLEGEHISDVICEFGSSLPQVEPRLCGIEGSWFPLAPGESVGNASEVPFFLPSVGINLEPGLYVVVASVRETGERLSVAIATLDVTN